MHDFTFIKNLRKDLKITQKELGEEIGVSAAYIQQLENNIKSNPSIVILASLSNFLTILINQNKKILSKEKYTYYFKKIREIGGSIINSSNPTSEEYQLKNHKIANLFVGTGMHSNILQNFIDSPPSDDDTICFKSLSYYKNNILEYWEDVITWFPLDKLFDIDLNQLSDNEIKDIAEFLQNAFKLKIIELKEKSK